MDETQKFWQYIETYKDSESYDTQKINMEDPPFVDLSNKHELPDVYTYKLHIPMIFPVIQYIVRSNSHWNDDGYQLCSHDVIYFENGCYVPTTSHDLIYIDACDLLNFRTPNKLIVQKSGPFRN